MLAKRGFSSSQLTCPSNRLSTLYISPKSSLSDLLLKGEIIVLLSVIIFSNGFASPRLLRHRPTMVKNIKNTSTEYDSYFCLAMKQVGNLELEGLMLC